MGTTEDADPADGDRYGPRPRSGAGGGPGAYGESEEQPRSRVERWSRGRWRDSEGAPGRPSRLGSVPPTRVDPEAATRRVPAAAPRFDPEAATRRVTGGEPRFDPQAPTKVREGGRGRFDPDAVTEVVRPRPGTGPTPSWQDGIGPGPASGGGPGPYGGSDPGLGVSTGFGFGSATGPTTGSASGPTTGSATGPTTGPTTGSAGGSGSGEASEAFPSALRDRFVPLGRAGAGSEGTVWYVRRTDGGGDAAVKVAASGQPMDHELLAHLRNDGFRRHVPHLIDFGRVRHHGALVDWVAMEYLPVTLAAHVAELWREGGHTDRRATEQIVYELVALLDFWQQRIKRNPLDFKPANILVRPGARSGRGSGGFVIADFGGVDRLTDSRRFTSAMMVTVAYMAPEQLAGKNHQAGPWWGLGNVLYELFVGRPRFVGADGERAADQELELELVMGEEVDLAAVRDPRQLLLLQGLFTKKPEDRWTAPQVRSWLAGGTPEVIRRRPQAQARAHRPVTFLGNPFTDPVRLAEALLRNSGAAARWLSTGGAERLRDWLRDEVEDTVFDLHHLTDVARAPGSRRESVAAVAVLALGAAFAPSATPHYRDRPIDTAGLERVVTEPDGAELIDELVRYGAPVVAARYDCFHPECAGEHCSRLLALAELPQVLAEVNRLARTVGGGRRGGDGLSPQEREEAHRQAVWLSVRPEERERLLGRLSPLPVALHRLPLPGRVSELAALVAAVLVDGALTVTAGVRTAVRELARKPAPDPAAATPREVVRRRWSALRRQAVGADPAQPGGRAALVAVEVLRRRGRGRPERPEAEPGVRREGPLTRLWRNRRRRPPVDWRARLQAWWPQARAGLPRRAGAVLLLLLGFGLLLWAGAVLRYPVEAGEKLDIAPGGAFGGPLRTAGDQAAREAVGRLGAAFVAAAVLAFFPARVGVGTALLTGAGAFAIGFLRLGPPMTAVEAPQPVADRVVMFEGGMGSWAGIAAVVAIVVSLWLIERASNRLLKPAQDARRRAREASRAGAARAGSTRTGVGGARTGAAAGQWRGGNPGVRERLWFALGTTAVLVLLLWAAVEVRLAVTGVHPTPASWGTGQAGAAYQAGFVVLLAVVSLVSTLGTRLTARALFAVWIPATVFLGAWPGPLGPVEALRIPVFEGLFGALAGLWGHGAFWAALLVALPLAAYGVLRTVRGRPGER
ncbi:protein kinase-like protein [Streptomyces sp. 1114.5]|uniref:protein kinase domain-containing protein n=1 Tax=Streptomyces sp. 1114.5 TaxID=1938830 RepID=UPI000EB39B55|nr:hypothetical protein [Streptomyces sp. 1114.5]RKT11805.1 protein kinase-like protein [Streptomyces sp. 1114.5]